MSQPNRQQERTRARVEAVIRVMAPALDLVLVAGDGLSRVLAGRHDPEPLALHPPDYRPPQLERGRR